MLRLEEKGKDAPQRSRLEPRSGRGSGFSRSASLLLSGDLRPQAVLLVAEFGGHRFAEVFHLKDGADLDLGRPFHRVGTPLEPLNRFGHRADCQSQKPAISSFVSANGPSITVRSFPVNRTRAPFELGWSPSPASMTPALTSSSLYCPIWVRSSVLGMTPASVPVRLDDDHNTHDGNSSRSQWGNGVIHQLRGSIGFLMEASFGSECKSTRRPEKKTSLT